MDSMVKEVDGHIVPNKYADNSLQEQQLIL